MRSVDFPEPSPPTRPTSEDFRDGIWREEFRPHSYEVDFQKRATLETVARRFQEAAWNHAETLGVGYERLQQENKIWVLARLLIQVTRVPSWGEATILETWPRVGTSALALRDFAILNANRQTCVAGSSAWLILDRVTRKPQRLDKWIATVKQFADRRALERDPEKIGPGDAAAAALELTARYSDLDVNGHVNNARYLSWILDSYSIDFHRHHAARSIELNFLAETRGGDSLSVLSKSKAENEYWHGIVKRPAGGEVCRAKLSWQ